MKLIGEQINALRKFFGLNQTEFGAKIGLKGSSVSNYEVGRVSVPDSVVLSICREFGCDEKWLRTGEGEMFPPRALRDEVAGYMERLLASTDASSDFQLRFIKLLSEIPSEFWPVVEGKARAILFGESCVEE